jgi:hypothetical protein
MIIPAIKTFAENEGRHYACPHFTEHFSGEAAVWREHGTFRKDPGAKIYL